MKQIIGVTMLKPSQQIVLKTIETFGNATLNLATSVEPLPRRLVSTWITHIRPLRDEPNFKLLPDFLRKQIESFAKSLEASGDSEVVIGQRSIEEIGQYIKQIIDIYADSISRRT